MAAYRMAYNSVIWLTQGIPVECAERYEIQGADELVLLDITATTEGRKTFTDMVLKSSDKVFMPLTVWWWYLHLLRI